MSLYEDSTQQQQGKRQKMRNKISGIYEIRNTETGKVYIGQSKNIMIRWRDHIARLKKQKHDNQYLQNAWNKYGAEAFSFSILETCEPDFDKLNELEIKWIALKNALDGKYGYNIASGGGNANPYSGMDEETFNNLRKAVSERQKKYYQTHSSPNKGTHLSEEARRHLSEINMGEKSPMYGKKRPDHSEHMSGSGNPRARRVKCIETGEEFGCVKEAAEKYGTDNSNIIKMLSGFQKTAAGKTWAYV